MVKLEISSTTVFSAPSGRCRCSWASINSCGIARLHHAEADEQAAEQQNFGRQEQPHTDLAGIELLLHRGEVMLMVRIVAVAVVHVAVRVVLKIDGGCAHACVYRFRPVIVGRALEHRLLFEIVLDGRRGRLPLQRRSAPGIVGRIHRLAQRSQQISRGDEQARCRAPRTRRSKTRAAADTDRGSCNSGAACRGCPGRTA